jgi:Zn-dependent M32 family carboxypeptidase
VKPKTTAKAKRVAVGISREVWEWAKSNPRYESLMEELEDLEDFRREKAKREKGIPFSEVLREYELTHHVRHHRVMAYEVLLQPRARKEFLALPPNIARCLVV